jgi:hypothetical protein
MTDRRPPTVVSFTPKPLPAQEPFEGEYGPLRDEIFSYIDSHTDQKALAGGKPVQCFEW